MDTRKRQKTISPTATNQAKRVKSDEKENLEPSSDDSFDNFCETKIEKGSPKSRSQKIEVLENEDDEDSFDSPVTYSEKKESGVQNFPNINSGMKLSYLKVMDVKKREDCLDLECKSRNGQEHVVYLQDRWSEANIEPGDMINLIGAKKWADFDFIVDDESILIINPDVLVPCTSTASATWCPRKIVLNDRFKFGNGINKAMLLGNIAHQIFQIAIVSKKRPIDESDLLNIWKSQASKYAEELVALSFTPNCLNSELEPYLAVICEWINKHVPLKAASFFGKKPQVLPTKSTVLEVFDIEENIWDPLLGLKGKIDVTMKTKNEQLKNGMESLELKTGKSSCSAEHMGQVLLYCIMLSSRYDQPIGPGNLLYLRDGVSKCITPKAPELFSILEQRNNLARYLVDIEDFKAPAPKSDARICEKCDQRIMCSFVQKKEEKFEKSSENMRNFAEGQMQHLEERHLEYASNWIRWISAEWASENERNATKIEDIWLKTVEERVGSGKCVENLEVVDEEVKNSMQVVITFRKLSKNSTGFSYKPGDICILSSKKRIAISFAIIDANTRDEIRIVCDKKIRKNHEGPFLLDKYTSTNTFSTTLGNLNWFLENDENGQRLREILVDLKPPRSVEKSILDLPPVVKKIIIKAKLNNEQRMAVINSMATQDFLIVEGLPGSGKTTMISVLIQCLLATGKSVLMTAFTHSAVDNILVKLGKEVSSDSILRLGSKSSMKSDVLSMGLDAKLESIEADKYYENVKKIMKNTPIVACTCHHVPREPLFSYRNFDVVIIDEASMVMEALLLPVLATSQKFVLVGDCKQLTPLVLSRKSKKEGADVSTMQKLQNAHEKAVISLTSQYRMNCEISKLSSELFYQNRLICGNAAVSRSCLARLADYKENEENAEDCFKTALSAEIQHSVVFLNTSEKEMQCEDGEIGGISNVGEAEVVAKLCRRFLENGILPSEIGVMSAYRRQVECIRGVLKNEQVEVNTIDSYQGREKRVVIWSMTWTNKSEKKSELLHDERRVNVALTRSRQKLVIIGCRKSLEEIPVICKMNNLIKNYVDI